MKLFFTVAVLFLFSGVAQADTLLGHTMRMARRGGIWHDRARGGGAEVVAKVSPGFGQRWRAMQTWRRSRPHNAILNMRGILRVRCYRGYCTGRK